MENRRLLIICYYWPPAGGPGVQRWLKFCKYLPEFGWQPTVYIPENPSYPLIDESLIKEIPKNIQILKKKIWEPYRWAEKLNKNNKKFKAGQFDIGKNQNWKSRISIWIRGNFFIPDARVFWVKPSIKFLKKHLKEDHYDAIITTGPPHSLHLIGLGLKRHFPKLNWIADFRDPWTEISYHKHLKLSKLASNKHRDLEKKVFHTADLTLATSFTDAENFRNKGAHAKCITNGYDTDALPSVKKGKNKKFTLSYIGGLEQMRNPKILWEILKDLIEENSDFKEHLLIKFVGKVDDKILAELKSSNIARHIQNIGYLAHDEALKQMQSADLLLMTNFPESPSKGIIPGKIFEYIATGNTIISFGPKDADVDQILRNTRTGKHFDYNAKEHVKAFVLERFEQWQNDILPEHSQRKIEQFSRKELTKVLCNELNALRLKSL